MDKRIFNIIPGADGSCCMLLYGYFGEFEQLNARGVITELLEAERTYSKIDARINSYGGDVYTGMAIFNGLRNSQAEVTIYVDGVAASIGAIVALCGPPVYMSKHSRLMLHSASACCCGNKSDMKKMVKNLQAVEDTLAGMLAEKTGKTAKEIKDAYFDDQDHWITAQEALELGFIDGIYDDEEIPENSTTEQIYNIYMNRLEVKSNTETMIEELKKRPTFANCVTEADVIKNIAILEEKAARADGLENTNKALTEENTSLKAEKAATLKAENDEIVNNAFTAGRISEPEKAIYMKALEGDDRAETIKVLEGLPEKRRIENVIEQPAGGGKSAFAARKEEIRNKTNQ